MMIEFLCPNGHQIHCSVKQAGRAAKCPRCGVGFRVPSPEQVDRADADVGLGDDTPPASTDTKVPRRPQAAARQPQPDEQPGGQIEFLCPAGHRLHGPAGLQGKPGECPECGSRFRIPVYDDVSLEEEELMQRDLGVGRAGGGGDSQLSIPRIDELTEAEEVFDIEPGASPTSRMPHPLATLLARLWTNKPDEVAVEIQLDTGQTLTAQHFAADLSQASHGVLAVEESDGTYTLSVVAWDAVARITLRGLENLPKEMADRKES